MFTDHYYRLKSIQETIQEKDSGRFCSICFQQINSKSKCSHDLGTQNLQSTILSIKYIQEKQIAEAQINGEAILVEDSLVPKFYVKGKYNEALRYKIAPLLNLPLIGVIVDDEGSSAFDCDGEPREIGSVPIESFIKGEGYFWGYLFRDIYYPISGFQSGEFTFEGCIVSDYKGERTRLPVIDPLLELFRYGYVLIPVVKTNRERLLYTTLLK